MFCLLLAGLSVGVSGLALLCAWAAQIAVGVVVLGSSRVYS